MSSLPPLAPDPHASGGFGPPPRTDVVGVPISRTSYQQVLHLLEHRPDDRGSVFYFCNVHSVMSARRDVELLEAIAAADVATSDGMPLVWALRRLADPEQQRVYGPDLMEYALPHGVERGWRHYFLGATDETLTRLAAAAEHLAPGVEIVGTHAPPFQRRTPGQPVILEDEGAILADIRASGTDLLWVGLGMPKQELWIHRVRDELPGIALLGVGAAFDLLSGTVTQAPDWIQERGLEWAYRLMKEPRRLWRRYAVNNPAYLALLGWQLARRRFGTSSG